MAEGEGGAKERELTKKRNGAWKKVGDTRGR